MPMLGYKIKGYYKINREMYVAHWPRFDGLEPDREPDRRITLYDDDILTKDPETGYYMLHTGIACFGIIIPDSEVTWYEGSIGLSWV